MVTSLLSVGQCIVDLGAGTAAIHIDYKGAKQPGGKERSLLGEHVPILETCESALLMPVPIDNAKSITLLGQINRSPTARSGESCWNAVHRPGMALGFRSIVS